MTIKLKEGFHLTATNKRHIKQMLEQGLTSGQSKRLAYTLEPMEGNQFDVTIRKNYSDDWGNKRVDTSNYLIEIN